MANSSATPSAKNASGTLNQGTRSRGEGNFGRFDFVKWSPLMGGISLVLTIIALVLIFTKGMNYGIDFAGGTEIEVKFDHPVEARQIREVIQQSGVENAGVQSFGSVNDYLIRLELPHLPTEEAQNKAVLENVGKVRAALKDKLALADAGVLSVATVGPQIGSELKRNGFLAAFYSFLVILIYVGIRFDYNYAPGAVLCLVHDSIVTVGVFSLLGREFNTQIMAAVLTLIGYSLNDTIVTFDRIRETAPLNKDKSTAFIINKSINDMFVRTLLTSSATMIAVLALYFFGGGVISEIAFTLVIGILIGTYSSIYVAAPLVLVMERFNSHKAMH
jgi:preprotein translocase subunit SecF